MKRYSVGYLGDSNIVLGEFLNKYKSFVIYFYFLFFSFFLKYSLTSMII